MKRNKVIDKIMDIGGMIMYAVFLVLIGENFGAVAWWYAVGASFGLLMSALSGR